ncbi:helix-turn-helix transcriptional regulator [Anaerorhabdus sp.]|uniref:helix-turn-helix transcriptional regulator n=1 Tax=Anaerorhabdus sp. TaxID=1872524 RepID=UPI002FC96A4B
MLNINKQERISPKQIRNLLGLSQEEIALKLNISREHYARIEKDSNLFRKSKIDVAINLAKLGGLSLDQVDFFWN